MRVVILSDFATPSGGAQKVAVDSACALAEAGVKVTFIHAIKGADDRLQHPAIERICLDLADVWDLPAAKAAVEGVWNRAAAEKLGAVLAKLDRSEPIVLHAHQWTRAFSPSILSVATRSGLPFVVTAHDYFIACPNGVYFRFDQQKICALKPLSLACITASCDPRSYAHKAVRVARSYATAAILKRARFDIVHVSNRGRDTLVPHLPAQLRHHRIDNPVSVEQGAAAEIGPDAAFAFIGRLTREKGAVVAAQAARQAGSPIWFIGEGPAKEEIMAANPQAQLLGWLPKTDIIALMASQIRAVIAPSLWCETGPLTVYEAAAAGVPAIASDRCGAAERIVHGETGLVAAPEPNATAAAMRRLREPGAAQSMGTAAYARFWAGPTTPQVHAHHLVQLYEGILAAASRPNPR